MNYLSNLSSYIKITRPVNVFITFISIIVASIISINGHFEISKIIFAAVSGGLTAGAGNIINDIFDLEIDKINRPARPLVSGKLKLNQAAGLYLSFIVFAIILSTFINLTAFVIEFVTTILLFLYSLNLKKIPLVGNIVIAFLTGLAFIYGGVAVNNFAFAIIPAIFAFLINLLRELVKDMEDVRGDTEKGVSTFPHKYGFLSAKKLIFILTFILILATLYPFLFDIYDIKYFLIIMVIVNPVLIYFLKSIFDDDSTKNLNKLSFILKLNMLFGLIAIYLGTVR